MLQSGASIEDAKANAADLASFLTGRAQRELDAEAEDEALHHLYYRQSMKGPSKVELNKALGKLINTLTSLKEKDPSHAKIPEVTHYVIQIYKKLEDNSKATEYEKELLATSPDSKWAKYYK